MAGKKPLQLESSSWGRLCSSREVCVGDRGLGSSVPAAPPPGQPLPPGPHPALPQVGGQRIPDQRLLAEPVPLQLQVQTEAQLAAQGGQGQ